MARRKEDNGNPRPAKQRQEDEDDGKNQGKTFGELRNEQERAHREYPERKWWQKK